MDHGCVACQNGGTQRHYVLLCCLPTHFRQFSLDSSITVVYFDVEWGEVKPSTLLKISSWNRAVCCCYVVIVAETMAVNKLTASL